MIKNYLELNKFEVEKFIQFINRNKINKLSFEDMDKEIKSKEFDFGRGVILKIKGQDIIGMASIILKECNKKGIAYIIKLDINESIEDKRTVLCELIEESKKIAKKYGAKEIFLGTKDDTIIRSLNALNIKKQYSAIKMTLDNIRVKYSPLSLVKLSSKNKKEYLTIYNDAFKEVPNAATLTESDIDEYIKKADENNSYYIVTVNNEMIGFLQFNIKNGVGEFDLGLIKSARGKGYGKLLLETAINFLNLKNVKEIALIVITKNTLAYDMYKKRGFKESELVSDWFKLN
ncbi:Acetyltransferase (GNAT) family protein [Caminicella sporogenes DSM 14501]|uniref:Acetyltransferase (GNAT) family protein n=1 Tax=Caminicella sporogenes DSM 14501 TaxID=1121266 RepID=A0A1M6LTS7_9FIRM|nr:GNAT family N-acetyltransferase [Caminicella sporogenes]RKD27947.1 GNAT family N-acetyltransferase [Caminicella sporogenes]SHJ74526.1 Acetyltransferase (GNAT) family protein [Caminicella sporogenes DSM 14501]